MNASKAVLAGILGTTGMTLFSYCVSENKARNFKEPVLLADMIKRTSVPGVKNWSPVAGWFLHFLIGVMFALVYRILLKQKSSQHPITFKFLIGGLSGLLAVVIWKTTFVLHPNPPVTSYKRFYGQLVVAHIIFGTITLFFLDFHKKSNPTSGFVYINNN